MPLARGRRSRTRPRDRLGYEQVRTAIVRPARALDVEAIRGQPRVQLVRHRTVEITVVFARVGAELPEVEPRVQRLERVHGPRHDLDALIEAVIALSLLECEREAAAPMLAAHR